jgi:energy-coupling factor transporter ATP-binding protein EcfA2
MSTVVLDRHTERGTTGEGKLLKKIHIQNYRVFEDLTLEFTDGLNVIVGNNDAGKSTLLEAVHLALTSRVRGRFLANELSPHLFNQVVSKSYLEALASGDNPPPPEIIIDLFLEELEETATLKGTNNSSLENLPGLRIRVHFWEEFADEYASFVANPDDVRLVPTEYYKVDWLGFNGRFRSYPVKVFDCQNCGAAQSWVPRKKLVLRELRWPRLAAGTSVLRTGESRMLVRPCPFPFSFSSRLRGFLD